MNRREGIILRRFRDDDFDAFHAMVSDFDVVKNTASWPHPADPEFTRMRMNTPEARAGLVNVVEVDGKFAGTIGLVRGELGYTFAREFWGRGLATAVVAMKLADEFRTSDLDRIEAGAFADNPASRRVLEKNGFTRIWVEQHDSKSRGASCACNMFRLTRQDWINAQPMRIETDRLVLEPFAPSDATAFSNLMNCPTVTDNMATIPAPFTPAAATEWISAQAFAGVPGFSLKITLRGGTPIGFVRLNRDPIYIAYALGEPYRGQGYATEAAQAFVTECCQRFALTDITAGAFVDNPASQTVLAKLGFEKVGEHLHKTSTRLEPGTLYLYRFTRNLRKHYEIS